MSTNAYGIPAWGQQAAFAGPNQQAATTVRGVRLKCLELATELYTDEDEVIDAAKTYEAFVNEPHPAAQANARDVIQKAQAEAGVIRQNAYSEGYSIQDKARNDAAKITQEAKVAAKMTADTARCEAADIHYRAQVAARAIREKAKVEADTIRADATASVRSYLKTIFGDWCLVDMVPKIAVQYVK